jgi:hypothetical protein
MLKQRNCDYLTCDPKSRIKMVSNWSCISAIQANRYRVDQDQEAARLGREKYNRESLLDTRDAKKKERRNKGEKKTTGLQKYYPEQTRKKQPLSNSHPSLTMTAVVLHGIPPAHEMRL